ncbi:MAG: T9SS type A sorting domain-containing protein [Ferruginibacter sp.]
MLTNLKLTLAVLCLTAFVTKSEAQQGTLEFTSLSSNTVTTGPTISPVSAIFREDIQNLTVNTHFKTNTPAITASFSFARQRFTSAYASNVSTGMTFGGGSSAAVGGATQVAASNPVFNALGATLLQPPQNGMFVSSPTGTPVVNWQLGGRGVGLDPEGTQNGSDDDNFGNFDYSFGTAIYTTVEPLKDSLKDGRYYYGDLVIKFSRTVKDPVVHIAGLGGSYEYINLAAQTVKSYFTTELELTNPGVTSTFMAGNEYFNVVSATNKILNSAPSPNGGSYSVGAGTNYGAATGSVKINGTLDSLVYKVYVRGSVNSQFSFSALKANISGATRDPFNGDLFYMAISMNKPTQQISGNVFIDKDVTDNDVNKSFGLGNERTNANGQLYANLISGTTVVATMPIAANGTYLFDNVAVGTYTVQMSSTQGVVGQPKPATVIPLNWTRTAQFIGSGPGTDGATGTSRSFTIAASDILTNVNFGIKAGNCPDNILYTVPPSTNYFGGFELAQNFFPIGVNLANGPGRVYANTPLVSNTSYTVATSPDALDASLNAYAALGGSGQMVVKPTATNQVAYYLVDSLGKNGAGFQTYLLSGSGSSFKGWFAKSTAADAVVKIKIYDADDPTKVFADVNVSVTGAPGNWIYWNQPWTVNYGTPPLPSTTKKVRLDIISENGAPFSIDELCFTENAAGPVLPIGLSDFTATKSDCTANLVWKTSTESNSDRFEVEVKTNNNSVYSIAGIVAASGYSSASKTYQYSYPMQPGVVYYFRLKMIDKDGTFIYSDTRSASCSKGRAGIVIAPNPVKTSFTITGMENGKNSIVVYASNGQLVKTQVIAQNQGEVNVSYLAPGMYTVKVTSENGNTVVEKLIKY